MWIIIVGAIVVVVGILILIRKLGGGKFPWVQFYSKGKESGFSFKEINLLRKVAIEGKLKEPTSLFWSVKVLDHSIRDMILRFRAQGKEHDEESVMFLAKLFDFRKRVEFDLPKYKIGIKSSRNIAARQRMKIVMPGIGVFMSTVVENLRKYLAISYPEGKPLPPGFSWRGQDLNIYFWRAEDAGYYFQSKVLDDYFDKKYPLLHITHSDSLVRTQKRGSIRVDADFPLRIFSLKSINQANDVFEKTGGLKAKLLNISEDGAAMLVGGKAKPGLALKIQFEVSDSPVVMCGVIKGTFFDEKKNQSRLHIQAIPPKPHMRNAILTYVYDIFNERSKVQQKRAAPRPQQQPQSVQPAGEKTASQTKNN